MKSNLAPIFGYAQCDKEPTQNCKIKNITHSFGFFELLSVHKTALHRSSMALVL